MLERVSVILFSVNNTAVINRLGYYVVPASWEILIIMKSSTRLEIFQ